MAAQTDALRTSVSTTAWVLAAVIMNVSLIQILINAAMSYILKTVSLMTTDLEDAWSDDIENVPIFAALR